MDYRKALRVDLADIRRKYHQAEQAGPGKPHG